MNSLRFLRPVLCSVFFVLAGMTVASAYPVDDVFGTDILPLLDKHCTSCHSGDSPEAKFDVTHFKSADSVATNLASWQMLVSRIEQGDMPPAEIKERVAPESTVKLTQWTQTLRRALAEKHRGDPGIVGVRRLNNAEYNNTIRDLTGVDIRPTKSFPIDPANAAGFDNSAESLTISPALAGKYIDAARFVADHMLLSPDGIRFAPFPVVTETDRDRYCVQRIVDFYSRQPIQVDRYLLACWKLQHDKSAGLSKVASEMKLSAKYLGLLQGELFSHEHRWGPLAELRSRWDKSLASCRNEQEAALICRELANDLNELREKLTPKVKLLRGPRELNQGSQSLILWYNREVAKLRRTCRTDLFHGEIANDSPLLPRDRDSLAEHRDEIQQAYQSFCELLPDAFFILERGRPFSNEEKSERKGRLLSAGFHSMTGYFRDDGPLMDLILEEPEKTEIDRLWREFELISLTPIRQYAGFIWFERAESGFIRASQFDFARAEDKSVTSEAMIQRFAQVYEAKVRSESDDAQVIQAVTDYFVDINRQIRALEQAAKDAEQVHLESLLKLAEQANRQPLGSHQRQSLLEFYAGARTLSGADHRTAMEDTLVSILVSPSYLFRWDLRTESPERVPLNDRELANRLSYFLWASKPDAILEEIATSKSLSNDEALLQQTKRMIEEPRCRSMLVEFVGNWLEVRRFDEHKGVDREQFPSYDDALQRSMADEPIEFLWDWLKRDGSLNELIEANHLIVNQPLATHYGISVPNDAYRGPTDWFRIEGVQASGRSGLLSMGAFLTQNSPGLRTSPVKRGYWVVRRLLGEKIPPPPPNVPELPNSEKSAGDLTLRQLLEKHREHPSCAACHQRFDSIGLLLEQYDPIGRVRSEDLGGRPVSAVATLPNGVESKGLDGLKQYILTTRFNDFRRHFCESLLAYALGRSLIVSDDLLVEEMIAKLDANQNRVQPLFQTILLSPQFRNKRGIE